MLHPLARRVALAGLLLSVAIAPAAAQDGAEPAKRTRLLAGPQISPSWPGADKFGVGPYLDFSRAREGRNFTFEAPDESFGSPLIESGRFEFGPALGFIGKRSARDIGAPLPTVGFSIEAGAFAQMWVAPELRVRVEGRKALSGHDGWVGEVGADYVARDGDEWLVSIGPRVTLGDAKFHRAYVGVAPVDSAASGLAAYRPGGGITSVGVTAGVLKQIDRNWGVAVYGRYDRLVGDAARSPVVRHLGSRDQPSVGLALSYTFGGSR